MELWFRHLTKTNMMSQHDDCDYASSMQTKNIVLKNKAVKSMCFYSFGQDFTLSNSWRSHWDNILLHHWVLALTTQATRAESTSRWCTCLSQKETTHKNSYKENLEPLDLCEKLKSLPVQTVQGYKKWHLQWMQLPGQDDPNHSKED